MDTRFRHMIGDNERVTSISVAELKAAIAAAMQQVSDGQEAIKIAGEKLQGAQQVLGAILQGSQHQSVESAQAALAQAGAELEQCMAATLAAAEQAQSYAATL